MPQDQFYITDEEGLYFYRFLGMGAVFVRAFKDAALLDTEQEAIDTINDLLGMGIKAEYKRRFNYSSDDLPF